MHYLHKILVYIPDVISDQCDEMTREEKMDAVRRHADEQTSEYYGSVFDWRETDCAGRWSSEYPQNVIFAADDIDRFVDQIKCALVSQREYIDFCLKHLKDSVGTDLEAIVKGELDRKEYGDTGNGFNSMTSFFLQIISALLHGNYQSESLIYNSHKYTSRLFPDDIESIRQEPEKWAMVMFDCHN